MFRIKRKPDEVWVSYFRRHTNAAVRVFYRYGFISIAQRFANSVFDMLKNQLSPEHPANVHSETTALLNFRTYQDF